MYLKIIFNIYICAHTQIQSYDTHEKKYKLKYEYDNDEDQKISTLTSHFIEKNIIIIFNLSS